ncbi:arylamine N-acetyltransferase [Kitasatospora sp. NPDC088346]|uniref:arylamine N-acetyltransferase family protein n=1 Tax=Kitasatospora sp. NPDC088346 TaxID=3364073 RepID=UPI003826687A
MITRETVERYLHRLRLPHPGAPGPDALRRLHRAHVEHVPYENLEIQLGRPTSIDPEESIDRILRGRGGYCYHLNGAFSALLDALGYQVSWHLAGVHTPPAEQPPGADGNHLALTVLCEGERLLVDVALGDGLYEPLPLREGSYHQARLDYRMAPSEAVPGGWRLQHDPRGSFLGMDFSLEPAAPADFAAQHERLSTAADSPFVRAAVVQRRHADGFEMLRGLVLIRLDEAGRQVRELGSAEEWFDVLDSRFGLALDDVGPAERAGLWDRVQAVHRAWQQAQAQAQAAKEPAAG